MDVRACARARACVRARGTCAIFNHRSASAEVASTASTARSIASRRLRPSAITASACAWACEETRGSIFLALSRHRRRHVHCAGMGVPALKMSASERRSFGVPAHPCPRDRHAVGDAEVREKKSMRADMRSDVWDVTRGWWAVRFDLYRYSRLEGYRH